MKPGVDGPVAQELKPGPEPTLSTVIYIYIILVVWVNQMTMLKWMPVRPSLASSSIHFYVYKHTAKKMTLPLKIYNWDLL